MDVEKKTEDRVTRRRRRRRVFLILIGAAVLLAVQTFHRPLFYGNFGVVERERVYRAKQPVGNLDALISTYQLASVLNLRGGSPADPFYANEVKVTSARGVDFYDLPMSATRRPTRRELLLLIDLFGRCRYPLLIHCKSGADRTGLASGVYLMAGRGVGPDRALRAFTLHYGHVNMFGTETLHEPVVEYAEWLKNKGLGHTPARFREWVENVYDRDEPPAPFRPLRVGPRESVAAKAKGPSPVAR